MLLTALRKKFLGEVLLSQGKITKEQLDTALKEATASKRKLGEILLEKNLIMEVDLYNALSISMGVEFCRLEKINIELSVIATIPEKIARQYLTVPLELNGDELSVAMTDPTNVVYKSDIQGITGLKISAKLATEKDINEFIEKYYVRHALSTDTTVEDEDKYSSEQIDDIEDDVEAAPVVKYVNSMFFDAISKKASDIHLEPFEKMVSLRMRIDGMLINSIAPQKRYYNAIVSRIKIMSDLDIAERRLPQDGKCRVKVGENKIDVRVSIIPTLWGEKVVLRILSKELFSLDIDKIGFSQQELIFFKEAVQAPNGMILVTGPTSSGKTTTLYSALKYINKPDINISTAEDPVEYEIQGINQVHARADIGLTFASILRSFMRQDPDVILIGEIRDTETAQIAIQSALTGHLVFSTLHTNDTVSTISRLSFMGIESYLVSDAVNLIIAQRLVRTICPKCKMEMTEVHDSVYEKLGLPNTAKLYKGTGCNACDGSGYKGRVAIFEILKITNSLRRMISSNASELDIKDVAVKEGLVSLRQAAINKMLEGVTTVEEVFSVTSSAKAN